MERPLVVSTFLVLFFLLQACAPQVEQPAETKLSSPTLAAPMRKLEPTSTPASSADTHAIEPAATTSKLTLSAPTPNETLPDGQTLEPTPFPSPSPEAAALPEIEEVLQEY